MPYVVRPVRNDHAWPKASFVAAARRFARPWALWIDLAALSLATSFAVLSSYLRQTVRDPAMFLAARISVKNLLVCVVCWGIWTLCLWSAGLYQWRRVGSVTNLAARITAALAGCSMVTLCALIFRNTEKDVLRPILVFWTSGLLLMSAFRVLLNAYEQYMRPLFRPTRRAVVVGTGDRAMALATELPHHRLFNYSIAGFVDGSAHGGLGNADVPILCDLSGMRELFMREPIDEVFIALPIRSHYEEIAQVIALCEESGVQSQYQTEMFNTSIAKRRVPEGDDATRVVLQMVYVDHRLYFKRALDIVAAALGLLILSPLLLAIAVAVRLSGKGPIIFTQTRSGLNRRQFGMHKFRSMVTDAESLQAQLEHLNEVGGPVFKIRNDPRITPVGRLLRKTSLDELPQLWNVLCGDMSLVGPRPLPMRDVGNFSELALMRRFSVKPGITGLWQVSGRSNTKSFEGWIERDLEYIDKWSLVMDARILMRTLPAVLRGSGAS